MIRLCTLGVPLFNEGGIGLTANWREGDVTAPRVRETLKRFHGRFVQIHPKDIEKLPQVGLAIVDGALVEAPRVVATAPSDVLVEPNATGSDDKRSKRAK